MPNKFRFIQIRTPAGRFDAIREAAWSRRQSVNAFANDLFAAYLSAYGAKESRVQDGDGYDAE